MARGIVLGALSPHPPIAIPEIAEDSLRDVQKTQDGLQELANLVREIDPDTVVIISPHGPVLRDSMALLSSPILEGNFREFGVSGTSLRYGNDIRLVNRTVEEARKRGVKVAALDPGKSPSFRFTSLLHYSILVPLYYLKQAGVESRLVAGAAGLLPEEEWYRFGQSVAAASAELGVRVVYIASGDLSHRLTEGAPAGYDPMGAVFDQKVVEALGRGDVKSLMKLDPNLLERAGECGLGPIITMFGALDGLDVVPHVMSYEGPFGVGYCVATFTLRNQDASGRSNVEEADSGSGDDDTPAHPSGSTEEAGSGTNGGGAGAPAEHHPLVRLARLALETFVREGRIIDVPDWAPGQDRQAGAFVSLKKQGDLRGCIGTIEATTPSLAEEVIRNAIQSGTADPRFYPVLEDELDELVYSVDVLEPAEPVESLDDLDPSVYGVIVSKGSRTGLLLPDLEGIDTATEQVRIARQKAGISPSESGVKLWRFKVTRYH